MNDQPIRTRARAQINLRCEVRQGTRAWHWVVLEDLSSKGFRISGLVYADKAKPLSIRIPGMQLLTARICWTEGDVSGCEFSTELHVAVFEHVVRQARSA